MKTMLFPKRNVAHFFLAFNLLQAVTSRAWFLSGQAQSQVPCFFIFGDSLLDNGNNNNILTLARANYRPYGIDFAEGSSGRFTNGRTTVDVLGTYMHIMYIPHG